MEVERSEHDAVGVGDDRAIQHPNRDRDLDLSGGSNSLDQTGFLLQRLQELKQWQKEQEMKLLRDQREQINRLKGQGDLDTAGKHCLL